MACAAPYAFFQNWHSMLLSAKNIIAYPGLIVNPFFRLLKKIFELFCKYFLSLILKTAVFLEHKTIKKDHNYGERFFNMQYKNPFIKVIGKFSEEEKISQC